MTLSSYHKKQIDGNGNNIECFSPMSLVWFTVAYSSRPVVLWFVINIVWHAGDMNSHADVHDFRKPMPSPIVYMNDDS